MDGERGARLLLIAALLATLVAAASLGSSTLTLALAAARAATSVGRVERKVNVLLRLETNDERGRGDNLLTDAKG